MTIEDGYLRRPAQHSRHGVPAFAGKPVDFQRASKIWNCHRVGTVSRLKPGLHALNAVRGFSLIEVMVAVLILGVAVAGMVQGITAALSSSKESELQTTAALIAA